MPAVYLATRDVPLDELTPFPGNAKRGNVDEIRKSLRRNGQYRSLVVRDIPNGPLVVLAGNHTMQALAAEGHEAARCEIVRCDDAEARRINLADNRLAELGSYDDQALAELLNSLEGDYDGTGYDNDDLEALLSPTITELPPALGDPDDIPDAPVRPVTIAGDIWKLGPHRIACADCRDYDAVTRLLNGQRINIAFTSPPYASQRAYDETSGFKPIPPDEYTDWFEDVQANVRAHLADDGSWFVNIKEHCDDGQRHLYVKDLTIAHVRRWGWLFVDELCWVDACNGFPGGYVNRFKDAWEPVFHYSLNKAIKFRPLGNPVDSQGAFTYDPAIEMTMDATGYGVVPERAKGKGLARPSNVITIAAGGERGVEHSAQFPIKLPEWFIRAYTDEGDTVFDPFMGSGSTLLAAHRNQRVAFGTEISPGYCDVICRRYQQATGDLPILASTGKAHDFTREPANQ